MAGASLCCGSDAAKSRRWRAIAMGAACWRTLMCARFFCPKLGDGCEPVRRALAQSASLLEQKSSYRKQITAALDLDEQAVGLSMRPCVVAQSGCAALFLIRVFKPQLAHDVAFVSFHFLGVGFAGFMVPALGVQRAVNQQVGVMLC